MAGDTSICRLKVPGVETLTLRQLSPVQGYVRWIIKTPISLLFLFGILAYLIMALLFSGLYSQITCGVIAPGTACDTNTHLSFIDLFSFSMITQSTLGYGNLVPNGNLSHIFVIAHIISGLIFSSVFTGILVVRVLVPSPEAVVASPFITFDPDTHRFSVRLMNRISLDIFDVKLKMLSVRSTSSGDIYNRRQIKLMVDTLSYLECGVPTLVRTEIANKKSTQESLLQDHLPSLLAPDNLGEIKLGNGHAYLDIKEIRLIVSGHVAVGAINQVLKFKRNNIVCGRQKLTYDPEKKIYNWPYFYQINLTDQKSRCPSCQWSDNCSLRELNDVNN